MFFYSCCAFQLGLGQTIYLMLGVQKNFGLIFLHCFAFASFNYQKKCCLWFCYLIFNAETQCKEG
jgi:hypothetical protein